MANSEIDYEKKLRQQQSEERKRIEKEKSEKEKQQETERKETKDKYEKSMKKAEEKREKKMKREPFEMPFWVRIANLLVGLAYFVLSSFIIVNEDIAIDTSIYLLAGILFLSGATRFLNALTDEHISGFKQIIRFLFGTSFIIIALIVFIVPDFGEDVLVLMLALGLGLMGLNRILLGLVHEVYPPWYKLALIIIGVTSVLLAIGVAVTVEEEPDRDIILLLVYGFLLAAMGRILNAIVGLRQKKQM